MFARSFCIVLAAVISLGAIAGPVAASVTLDYTGVDFTVIGSAAAGTKITGYVVLKDFDTSANYSAASADLLDWSISNGAFTLSQAGGDAIYNFNMTIAAGGAVTDWDFAAWDDPSGNWSQFSRTVSEITDASTVRGQSYGGEYENTGPTGSWSDAASVPEPGSWELSILGLGVVGMAMRRRRSATRASPTEGVLTAVNRG